ncbi:MAG: adenosine deaminase family protein [Deltaproteobacteria bacterium]|nr:adenosine deaminase family protein [Deltaproteobacteria bacterium]
MRLSTLIELAGKYKVKLPSNTESGLRELVFKDQYSSLGEYLNGFKYTTAVLRDDEAMERAAYELVEDNISEGVRYLEVRFAPQLHIRYDFPAERVVQAVHKGMKRAAQRHNNSGRVKHGRDIPFYCGIIVCAMRMFAPSFSAYFKRLMEVHRFADPKWIYAQASLELARTAVRLRDDFGLPIVGFDLAGQEDGYPAEDHVQAYEYAHKHFLQKTVHAGEAYGAESIFQAITDLHADRIGHGYHLFSPSKVRDKSITDPKAYCQDLIQYMADRRTTIEVCLTSNKQTNPELKDLKEHNFRKMLDSKLSFCLCTDNRLVSNTTVTREIELAVDLFNMNRRQLKNAIVYGFKRSFFPGTYREKRAFVRKVLDRFEELEADFDLSD